jgi:hypothetical protein
MTIRRRRRRKRRREITWIKIWKGNSKALYSEYGYTYLPVITRITSSQRICKRQCRYMRRLEYMHSVKSS